MKSRALIFRPAAEADLVAIYNYIAEASGNFEVAFNFTERLRKACYSLADLSERGRLRDDILPGLRIITLERQTVIAYFVRDDDVIIANLFHGGQDWERAFRD